MMERAMSRAIVLTGAVVAFSVLAKRGRQNRSGGMRSNCYIDRASFKQFELTANNLKTATKKVDDSAARVEVALKTLAAA
jgi:orotate phosphoribosyltransferase